MSGVKEESISVTLPLVSHKPSPQPSASFLKLGILKGAACLQAQDCHRLPGSPQMPWDPCLSNPGQVFQDLTLPPTPPVRKPSVRFNLPNSPQNGSQQRQDGGCHMASTPSCLSSSTIPFVYPPTPSCETWMKN